MQKDEITSPNIELKPSNLPQSRPNWLYWILLVVIILFSGLIRYRLLDVPLERDEGEYAYAGQLILQGVPPYSEVYNMKLPGIYGIYALIISIFGQTPQGIHTGLLIINSITIILVFLLGKHLMNSIAAVVSAGAFAILSLSQSVQGIFANAEHFVIIFSLGGLLVLLKTFSHKSNLKLFIAGVLLCIGFVMKQHGMMFCILAFFLVILDEVLKKPVLWKSLVRKLLSLAAGMMVVIISLFLIMLICGVFKEFWFWTIEYARAYVSQVTLAMAGKIFINNFSNIFASAPLLWILAGFGIIAIVISKKLSLLNKIFLLLFALFSFISICPGFFFRPHYFILLLPCIALLCGAAFYVLMHWLSKALEPSRCGVILLFVFIICVGQSIFKQKDYFFKMTPFEVCRSTYGLNPFFESIPIADYIREHTSLEDTIGILGSEPQICFYSKRRSASGHIYVYPLVEKHKYALEMQNKFISETEANKPKFIIFVNISMSWLLKPDSNMHIFDWVDPYLENNYKRVGLIELFDDRSIYNWEPQKQQTISSRFYIQIYERNIAL